MASRHRSCYSRYVTEIRAPKKYLEHLLIFVGRNPFYTAEPSFLPSFAMKSTRAILAEALHTMERLWACSDFVAGTTQRSGPGNSQPYTARSKGSGVS